MIFVVTGTAEGGVVSATCATPSSALQKARAFADEGARDILIDADGQEYAPADFGRLFVTVTAPVLGDADDEAGVVA